MTIDFIRLVSMKDLFISLRCIECTTKSSLRKWKELRKRWHCYFTQNLNLIQWLSLHCIASHRIALCAFYEEILHNFVCNWNMIWSFGMSFFIFRNTHIQWTNTKMILLKSVRNVVARENENEKCVPLKFVCIRGSCGYERRWFQMNFIYIM